MIYFKHKYLLLQILFLLTTIFSNEKIVRIGISKSIPPFVIKEDTTGIEMDILRKSLEPNGYQVVPEFLPLARTFLHFEKGLLNGVFNVTKEMVKGFYTDTVITFQNCVISLADNNFQITKIEDLTGLNVVAFQKASVILGKKFNEVIPRVSSYKEIADQKLQIYQLFKERADVVIMEKNIFYYFLNNAKNDVNNHQLSLFKDRKELDKNVSIATIFTPTHYYFSFSSQKIRDDFNSGLKRLKESGGYKEIFKKYNVYLNQ